MKFIKHNTGTNLLFYARVAGMLYLSIIVLGISSEAFIRATIIVADDAASTRPPYWL